MAGGNKQNADHALLMALACGSTVESAARKAGVSESTVYRRLRRPAFAAEVKRRRVEMLERTCAMLTAASLESVKTLVELQNASHSGSVRLGAARAVLEQGTKLREMVELEERIAVLEQQLANRNGRR